jgi:hypothetical protein
MQGAGSQKNAENSGPLIGLKPSLDWIFHFVRLDWL